MIWHWLKNTRAGVLLAIPAALVVVPFGFLYVLFTRGTQGVREAWQDVGDDVRSMPRVWLAEWRDSRGLGWFRIKIDEDQRVWGKLNGL